MLRNIKQSVDVSNLLKSRNHWDIAIILYADRNQCLGHDTEGEDNRRVWFYFRNTTWHEEILNDFRDGRLQVEPYRLSKCFEEVKEIFYSYK